MYILYTNYHHKLIFADTMSVGTVPRNVHVITHPHTIPMK